MPLTPQQKAAATRRRKREEAEAATERAAQVTADAARARAAAAEEAAAARIADEAGRAAARAKRLADRRYLVNLFERVASTFAEVAGSFLVADLVAGHAIGIPVLGQAAVAGGAAAWAVVKGVLAKQVGNGDTPSLVPASDDPAPPPIR